MINYKILTGPFAGEIVEEGQVLDIHYDDLDDDLKERIVHEGFSPNDAGKEGYENTWDTEETDEETTMLPLSMQ